MLRLRPLLPVDGKSYRVGLPTLVEWPRLYVFSTIQDLKQDFENEHKTFENTMGSDD
jgi:hypothetical protein